MNWHIEHALTEIKKLARGVAGRGPVDGTDYARALGRSNMDGAQILHLVTYLRNRLSDDEGEIGAGSPASVVAFVDQERKAGR